LIEPLCIFDAGAAGYLHCFKLQTLQVRNRRGFLRFYQFCTQSRELLLRLDDWFWYEWLRWRKWIVLRFCALYLGVLNYSLRHLRLFHKLNPKAASCAKSTHKLLRRTMRAS
jgi:hypothetical protein